MTETVLMSKEAILRERARELAGESRGETDDRQSIGIVEIKLARERYAVEAAYVREVLPVKNVTPLPCTPAYVMGLINVRGQILSIIDLRVFFDLPRESATLASKVVVLRSKDMEVGVVADAVTEARYIPLIDIRPALPTMTGIREVYLRGIASGDLVILDGARLLGDNSFVVNEHVHEQAHAQIKHQVNENDEVSGQANEYVS